MGWLKRLFSSKKNNPDLPDFVIEFLKDRSNKSNIDPVIHEYIMKIINNDIPSFPAFHLIEADKMDYSVDSLIMVDRALVFLCENFLAFQNPYLSTQDSRYDFSKAMRSPWFLGVVYGFGFYAGEVIRQRAKYNMAWLTYEEVRAIVPKFKEILGEKNLENEYTLVWFDEKGPNIIFPLHKIIKFLYNGEEDSLYSLASLILYHEDIFENR